MGPLPLPLGAALLGGLAGAVEGFVLAIVVAAMQRRSGAKSAPAFPGQMVMGAALGALAAGIAAVWLGPGAAVGVGALAWPLALLLLALALRWSDRSS